MLFCHWTYHNSAETVDILTSMEINLIGLDIKLYTTTRGVCRLVQYESKLNVE